MTIQVRPLFLLLDEINLADKDFSALCQVADIVVRPTGVLREIQLMQQASLSANSGEVPATPSRWETMVISWASTGTSKLVGPSR
jgi:hypothetical protein